MPENLIRCACGKLYAVYSHYCGSQDVCPACRGNLQKEFEEQNKE